METINHESYVSLEVAELLKEVGFNWECRGYYDRRTLRFNFVWNHNEKGASTQCAAPTLEVAQRWLREVKNCSIMIDVFVHNLDKNNIYYTHNWIMYLDGERYSGSNWDDTRYYEVAQEAGIKKALELILKKGE